MFADGKFKYGAGTADFEIILSFKCPLLEYLQSLNAKFFEGGAFYYLNLDTTSGTFYRRGRGWQRCFWQVVIALPAIFCAGTQPFLKSFCALTSG